MVAPLRTLSTTIYHATTWHLLQSAVRLRIYTCT
jgi:hypothetical protein